MTEAEKLTFVTRRIGSADPACGFRCGKHPLDDYFRRHALDNDQKNIGRTYVLEASAEDVANVGCSCRFRSRATPSQTTDRAGPSV